MTEACKQISGYLNCEFEVFDGNKSEDELLALFADLQKEGLAQGFSPLFIIPDETLAEAFELFLEDGDHEDSALGMARGIREIIEQAGGIDAKNFLLERREDYSEDASDPGELLGRFLEVEPSAQLNLTDLDGTLYPEIILAKIPAPASDLAAWAPMGGFNDCPAPAEQVAVFRNWQARYGAAPAVVSYDVWQLTVARPPLSNEEAEALAWEHYAFCCDIIDQAPEEFASIRALASNLRASTVWGFWWD